MADKLYSLLSKATIIVFALLFSQFPAYENSYEQRLSGHVDELRYHIELMKETAKLSGKTLDEFIAKFQASQDPDFHRQGGLMAAMQTRQIRLENALANIERATVLSRPFLFMLYFDKAIAKSTFKKYHFSLPLSFEGVVWAVIGAFLGYFLFQLINRMIRTLSSIQTAKKAA